MNVQNIKYYYIKHVVSNNRIFDDLVLVYYLFYSYYSLRTFLHVHFVFLKVKLTNIRLNITDYLFII